MAFTYKKNNSIKNTLKLLQRKTKLTNLQQTDYINIIFYVDQNNALFQIN